MTQTFMLTPVDQPITGLTEETAKQLAAAILTLNDTIKQQANNKNIYKDELWTLEHIAEYSHFSISTVRKLVVNITFPAAITPLGEKATKLWEQVKVKSWFKENKGKLPSHKNNRKIIKQD